MNVLGHKFNVDLIQVVGTPTVNNVNGPIDEIGLLLGLPRLPEERLIAYKQRLLDIYTNRSNSSYIGLINGITRSLGLSLFQPVRIYPRKDAGGMFLASEPVVVFNGPTVTLYSNYSTGSKELEFDRFDQDGVAYQIIDLANYISSNSIYFECNILDSSKNYLRAMTILISKLPRSTTIKPISHPDSSPNQFKNTPTRSSRMVFFNSIND